jgi:hypothetical protein
MQMFFCKYCALLFRYDVVNINLQEKPEWYFLKNPLGKVPTLETESGDCIYESLIVADYLDEKYPQTPLHSRDPMQKAKDRILIERFTLVRTFCDGVTLVTKNSLQAPNVMFLCKMSVCSGFLLLVSFSFILIEHRFILRQTDDNETYPNFCV